ncbi:MAG: DUF3298 domain-containing protein [Bacteroidaceae bacterium]
MMMKHLLVSFPLLGLLLMSCGAAFKSATITYDSISVKDSCVIKAGEVLGDYKLTFDYPTSGTEEQQTWIRQWLALETVDCADSIAATPATTAKAYKAAADKVYKGKLDDMKAMAAFASKAYLTQYKKENEDFNYASNYSSDKNIRILFNASNLITYLTTSYNYTGGAHGSSIKEFNSFSLTDNKVLTLNDMIREADQPKVRAMIIAGLQDYFEIKTFNELKNQLMVAEGCDTEQTIPFPIGNPGLTKKGITFTYGQYEIACYAAGMPEVTIPYKKIGLYLKPDLQLLLKDYLQK